MSRLLSQVSNEINLDDYFVRQRSLNSVIYIHKKFLSEPEKLKNKQNEWKNLEKLEDISKPRCRNSGDKSDILQQRNTDRIKYYDANEKGKSKVSHLQPNESILEQTIKFAKNILPIAIPESSSDRFFYTIKTNKEFKEKHSKTKKEKIAVKDTIRSKTDKNNKSCKKVTLHEKDNLNTHLSLSDTMEELRFNQSLDCTLSEISHKKVSPYKSANRDKNKSSRRNTQRISLRTSIEALAGKIANAAGDTAVKILIMDDTQKHVFKEEITTPILNSIMQCVKEVSTNVQYTHTVLEISKNNTEKLDTLCHKLDEIQKGLKDLKSQEKAEKEEIEIVYSNVRSPVKKVLKNTSTLEQLGEDMKEEDLSSEENTSDQSLTNKTVVKGTNAVLPNSEKADLWQNINRDNLASRKDNNEVQLISNRGDKVMDRSPRLPARFCWTDAKK